MVAAHTHTARYRRVLLEELAPTEPEARAHTPSSLLRAWSDVFSVLPAIITLAWETNSVSSISEALH